MPLSTSNATERDDLPAVTCATETAEVSGRAVTAAFALATNTIWQMGDALGGLRLAVIMLLGLTALVAPG